MFDQKKKLLLKTFLNVKKLNKTLTFGPHTEFTEQTNTSARW